MIAISALSYNSWRNELSEQNRNIRYAGFEIIKETAKLQQFFDQTTFESENHKSKLPIEGWVKIRLIQSLSVFMNIEVQNQANYLFSKWQDGWQKLKSNKKVNSDLSIIIDNLVNEVRLELSLLN